MDDIAGAAICRKQLPVVRAVPHFCVGELPLEEIEWLSVVTVFWSITAPIDVLDPSVLRRNSALDFGCARFAVVARTVRQVSNAARVLSFHCNGPSFFLT